MSIDLGERKRSGSPLENPERVRPRLENLIHFADPISTTHIMSTTSEFGNSPPPQAPSQPEYRPLPVASLQYKDAATLASSIYGGKVKPYPTPSSVAHTVPVSPLKFGIEEASAVMHNLAGTVEIDDEAVCPDVDFSTDAADMCQAFVQFSVIRQRREEERKQRGAFVQKRVRLRKRTDYLVNQATRRTEALMAGNPLPPIEREDSKDVVE